MRLTDLLQLINDLSLNTAFYLKIDQQLLAWSKLTLENGQCLLYPGQKPMTKAKLIKLVGQMHNRGIPLLVVINQQKYPIFGLQIQEEQQRAILM